MAGNDIYFFDVPAYPAVNDLKFRDPTTLGASSDFNLATTEAADAFAATIQEGFRLTTTEAADAAAFTLLSGANLALAATEASDVVALSVQEGFRFAATEAVDLFAGTLEAAAGAEFTLAAVEAADTASMSIEDGAGSAAGFDPGFWTEEWRKRHAPKQEPKRVVGGVEIPSDLPPLSVVPHDPSATAIAAREFLEALEDDEDEDLMLLAA